MVTNVRDRTARESLTRDRVLRTAVSLADRVGVDGLSMRKLAQEFGVVPMALYKHVANKEELLDGMVDVIIGEVDTPIAGADWRTAVRERILSARRALLRHPWASRLLETRSTPTPTVLAYMDEMIGLFRDGGLSLDITHHAMHTMGSRLFGFTQELFNDPPPIAPELEAALYEAMATTYPHVYEIYRSVTHDDASVVGGHGCDHQFEFEFALDLLLDGIEQQV